MALAWLAENARDSLQQNIDTIKLSAAKKEADTRVRAIDTMLYDVLKWDHADVSHEEYVYKEGYADYVFLVDGTKKLVLEAKRDEDSFVVNGGPYEDVAVPFRLLAEESKSALAALKQVQGYAVQLGAQYMAISNGRQWLMALTFVPGQDIEDRMVLVFESLDAVEARFRGFFECFSPKAIASNLPILKLSVSRSAPAPAKLATRIDGYPVQLDRRSTANKLRTILPLVWDEMSIDPDNPVFLRECYINPEPSEDMLRVAEEWLKQRSATDDVISQSHAEAADPDRVLRTLTREPKKGESGRSETLIGESAEFERPIVLLGRIGYGKTTFLKYLRNVKAKDILLSKYLQFDLDFTQEPASAGQVEAYIIEQIETQLKGYGIDINSDKFVRHALRPQLREFEQTPRGVLFAEAGYASAKKEAEVRFLESHTSDRMRYLAYAIRHIRHGHNRSVAIFFDNLDRRDKSIQEQAFLQASAIAKRWAAVVFVCLRPSTVQESRATGVLDSVATRTLYISPPKTAMMLRKRFQYAAAFAMESLDREAYSRASFSAEVKPHLPEAAKFFETCDESVRKKPTLAQQFEAVANGNVRLILHYVRELLMSNHLDTVTAMKHIKEGRNYLLNENETLAALLFGPYVQYEPTSAIFTNLFHIARSDPTEHFARLFLLEFFHRHAVAGENFGFVTMSQARAYMAQLGYTDIAIDDAIGALTDKSCIEGRDISDEHPVLGDEVRATGLGRFHISTLVRKFAYLDATVVDTPVLDPKARTTLQDAKRPREKLKRARDFLRYLDWAASELPQANSRKVWEDISGSLANNITDVETAYAGDVEEAHDPPAIGGSGDPAAITEPVI